jgi:hypothetical protein
MRHVHLWEIDQDGRGANTWYVTVQYADGETHWPDDPEGDLAPLLTKYADGRNNVTLHYAKEGANV